MKLFLIMALTIASMSSAYAKSKISSTACEKEARKSAIIFYNSAMETDDGGKVADAEIKPVPQLKGTEKEPYDVLELNFSPGKMGNYRVRLIYATTKDVGPCNLIGKEFLDMNFF